MWTWKDVDEQFLDSLAANFPALARYIATIGTIHSKPMMAYLTYMAQRVIEMHRVLKDTGSLYLHCDSTASHYLKLLCDGIFRELGGHFRNDIVWCYKSRPQSKKYFGKKHDDILFYTKSDDYSFNWDAVARPLSDETVKKYRLTDKQGRKYRLQGRGITGSPIRSAKDVDPQWEISNPEWTVRDYLDEKIGVPTEDWWLIDIINQSAKERTGYPTQKPLALIRRIIEASSNAGDIVLDPFCGCATTCVAAQQLDRKWIGIDIEKQAASVLVERLSDDAGLFKDFIATDQIPKRTDLKIVPPSESVKQRLYKEQQGECNACGREFEMRDLEIDHIIPKAKGGGDYYENYQLLCGSCNRIKGDRPMEYLRIKIETREKMLNTQVFFGE
jgi:site-specific DNA-methyltransferase (adenine-specific)